MDVDFKSKDEIYERIRKIICKSEWVIVIIIYIESIKKLNWTIEKPYMLRTNKKTLQILVQDVKNIAFVKFLVKFHARL